MTNINKIKIYTKNIVKDVVNHAVSDIVSDVVFAPELRYNL